MISIMHRTGGEVMSLVLKMLPSSNYSLCEVPPCCHLILSLSVAGLILLFSTARVSAVQLFSATYDCTELQHIVFQSPLFLIEEHLVIFYARTIPCLWLSSVSFPIPSLLILSCYEEKARTARSTKLYYCSVMMISFSYFYFLFFIFLLVWDNIYLELLNVTNCPS